MTAADRKWAVQYQVGDVLRYREGSKVAGIAAGDYATVRAIDSERNLLTVRKHTGEEIIYDPRRLRGITAYQPLQQSFAEGDRIQFTAPMKTEKIATRDLATIEKLSADGEITARTEKGREVRFSVARIPHVELGYAVTSHSSQGITKDFMLANIDGNTHPALVNDRLGYVAVSRSAHDAHICTDNADRLTERLGRDATKTSAVELLETASRDQSDLRIRANHGTQAIDIGQHL
jgi:hypothetical protein